MAEEQQVDRQRADDHTAGAEHKHDDKVGGAAAERAVLQVAAVAVGEDQVEEEGEAHGPKEQKRRDETPELSPGRGFTCQTAGDN